MARRMSRLDAAFLEGAGRAVDLALAGERIRSGSPGGSIARKELALPRIEALYETAYLRVFLAWEEFLEETFLRYICGYASVLGSCILLNPPYLSLAAAQMAVLSGADFVSWADPRSVVRRSQRYMTLGFHEVVLNSDLNRLLSFKAVRNRIAHASDHARNEFDIATRSLALRRYPGSSAGRFLRDRATIVPFPKTWLELMSDELAALAVQICG
jgi:hypothetical protein